MIQQIAVIGLGLIGGSFCKAVKAKTNALVLGFDSDKTVLNAALEYGAIDGIVTSAQLSACDLVLFALYPADTVSFVAAHLDDFSPSCILMDACGVKEVVCRAIWDVVAPRKLLFIGGHPMAGREFSGFAVSDQNLFQNASMVLTPPSTVEKERLNRLCEWLRLLGFSQLISTTPAFHDKMIAYTSQLPHVIASCYVKSPNCRYQLGFTGGSFEDMSRVARLNEKMWAELFCDNKENLIEEIETLLANLEDVRDALRANDIPRLTGQLALGRKIKEALSGKE